MTEIFYISKFIKVKVLINSIVTTGNKHFGFKKYEYTLHDSFVLFVFLSLFYIIIQFSFLPQKYEGLILSQIAGCNNQ